MEDPFKILIATDYSDSAKNAERYAIQLAGSTRSRLVFLHVYQIPLDSATESEGFVKNAEMLLASEMKCLEQHCYELFHSLRMSRSNLFCEYVVRAGIHVGKQVIMEAEESNSDFIIMGTHGISNFRKSFFGSHAWDVIKKSNRPVFAIPKEVSFIGIKKIVFGIECNAGEIPGLNYLVQFARRLNAEAIVLHVANCDLKKKFEKEMFDVFKNEILNEINYPKLKVHLLVSENISEGIHKFCAENKIDLLVMAPGISYLFEKYFMFNISMAKNTVFYTGVPFMAIPDFHETESHAGSTQLIGTSAFNS